jgi:hypothetical protein
MKKNDSRRLLLLFVFFSILLFRAEWARGQVVINEITPDPGNYDGQGGEWAELYNTSASAVDVSCYVLTNGEEIVVLPAGTYIPANGYLLVYNSNFFACPTCNWDSAISALIDNVGTVGSPDPDGTTSIDVATCGCTNQSASSCYAVTWQNGAGTGDRVVLFDASANIADAVYWGTGSSQAPAASPIPEITYAQGPNTAALEITGSASGCSLPASNNYDIPALPAAGTSNGTWDYAGGDINGCTTSKYRTTNGAGVWTDDQWLTPGMSNATPDYTITYTVTPSGGSPSTVDITSSTMDNVTLNLCSGATLSFDADVYAFNQVYNTNPGDAPNLEGGSSRGGSNVDGTGGLAGIVNDPWVESAITAAGVTHLNYPTTAPITSNSTITVYIKENTQGGAANANASGCAAAGANINGSGASSDCYIQKKITVNVVPALLSASFTCTNGLVKVTALPAGATGLTYELFEAPTAGGCITTGGTNIVSNTTGVFQVSTAAGAGNTYYVRVSQSPACGPTVCATGTVCVFTPPCVTSLAYNAACTPATATCVGDVVSLGVTANNLPDGGVIEWVKVANAGDDPYTTGTVVVTSTITSAVTPYSSNLWTLTGITSTAVGQSVSRTSNGGAFGASSVPETPNTPNESGYTGAVLINEVGVNPGPTGTCTDDNGEFVELIGTPGTSVAGYILSDRDFTIVLPAGTTIPADGTLIISNAGDDTNCSVETTFTDVDLGLCACLTGTWQFTDASTTNGEYLAMFNNTGTFIDGVSWGPTSLVTFTTASNSPCDGSIDTPDPSVPNATTSVGSGSLIIPYPMACAPMILTVPCVPYTIPPDACGTTVNIRPRIAPLPPTATCTGGPQTATLAAQTYTIGACPTATISGQTAICSGGTTSFDVKLTNATCTTATVQYSVNGGATQTSAALTISGGQVTVPGISAATPGMTGSGGVITLVSVTFGGCSPAVCSASVSGDVTVTINANPSDPTASAQEVCNGQATAVTATGGPSINWYSNVGLTTLIGSDNTFQYTGSSSTTIYAQAVNNDTGCKSAGTPVAITVNPLPTATPTGGPTACIGAPINFTAGAAAGTSPYTYAWTEPATGGTLTSTTAATTSIASAVPGDAGDYNVLVTDSKGCYARGTQAISVNAAVTAAINPVAPVCSATPVVTALTATGGGTYLWTGGATTATYSPTAPIGATTYTVTVTDNGCTSTASVTVHVNGLTTICSGTPISVSTTGCNLTGTYKQVFLLVNAAGLVVDVDAIDTDCAATFTTTLLAAGDYKVYALNYDSAVPPMPTLTVGTAVERHYSRMLQHNNLLKCLQMLYYSTIACCCSNNQLTSLCG